jgi:hypothetical protein
MKKNRARKTKGAKAAEKAAMRYLRVELSPHLDRWMMGDRYGDLVGVAKTGKRKGLVKVKLDKSRKTLFLKPGDYREI